MAAASLIISVTALVLAVRGAREARRARVKAEALLKQTLAQAEAMKARSPWREGDIAPGWGDRPLPASEARSLNDD